MIRRRIVEFTLEYADLSPIPVTLPCSLYSALEACGRLPALDFGSNADALSGLPEVGVTLRHGLSLSDDVLRSREVALVLSGIDAPLSVYLGGELVGEVARGAMGATLEIGEKLRRGARSLSLVFPYDKERRESVSFGDAALCTSVELIAYENAYIEDVGIRQIHENGNVTLHITEKIRGNLGDMKSIVTLVSPTGKMYYCGLLRGKGSIRIPDPELWWVHTHGKPKLYRLTLTLYRNGEPYDARTVNVGLRSLSLSEGKEPFALSLNGTRLFALGAEYRPVASLSRDGRARTEERIRALAGAGVNYLRVREGVHRLSDDFYELCDRYGILVGLELSLSPSDTELSLLRDELFRLGHHPSLALLHSSLCDASAAERLRTVAEDGAADALYCNSTVDLSRPVEAFDYTAAFATARSSPSLPVQGSLDRFLSRSDQNPFSSVAERRTVGSFAKTLADAAAEYPSALSYEQLIYLSELHQASSLLSEIEYLRRRPERAGGVVIADATDVRGAISPSLFDAYGRPKAALSLLEGAYSPTALLVERKGYRVTFFVSNERRTAVSGSLHYALLDARGAVLKESTERIFVEAGTLLEVASADFSTLAHKREREVVLVATLVTEENASRHTRSVFFVPRKHFAFCDPEIKAEVRGSGAEFEITLTPHAYAAAVFLSLDGYDAAFSDNCFDLARNAPYLVRVQLCDGTSDSESVLRALRIDCLNLLGKREF